MRQHIADATDIIKGKEHKAFSEQITQMKDEISRRLNAIPAIVQAGGYPDVQLFT